MRSASRPSSRRNPPPLRAGNRRTLPLLGRIGCPVGPCTPEPSSRKPVAACSGPSSARTATWRLSAELAADSWAASSPDRGVALASALLKIARTGARSPFDRLALSAIDDAAPLEARVRRLLDEQPRPAAASAHPRRRWLLAGLLMAPVLLRIVHQGVEAAVRHLP